MPEPLSEEQFRQQIYETHREHWDHVYTLHRFAEGAMCSYKGFANTPYKECLILIFARAFKSYDAVRRLCEVASCEDAAVILRSLLNLLVVVRWISLDEQKRARRYSHWYWVRMYEEIQKMKDSVSPDRLQFIQDRYDRVKSQFQYKDKKGAIRFFDHWYQPEANTIRDLFVQVDLEKHYEEAYRPLSGIEHSDATAFLQMITSVEAATDERRLEIQSDLFVPEYLRNAFQYFGDILSLCNRTIPLCNPSELEEILTVGKQFFEGDLKAHGRDPY